MRTRIGNPSNEAHGQPMRVYDWIAPAGTDPHAAMLAAETALGVKLYHRGDGEIHGYVNTSRRPDGSLYVCVHLYDTACTDPACPAGHGTIALRIAPNVMPQLAAMVAAVGEHPTHRLTLGNAAAVLAALGFTPGDGPFKEAS